MHRLDRIRAGLAMLRRPKRPLTVAEEVEQQHSRGHFDFLYNWEEVGHHMIALGYLPYLHRQPAILDVGCGQGRWFELLQQWGQFRRYVGLDLSATAVRAAAKRNRSRRATFVQGDFETWQTSDRFDIILFNESLYYSEEPHAVLRRFARFLTRSGAFIVSIHEHHGHEAIWDEIAGDYQRLASDSVTNSRGQLWAVRALRPRFKVDGAT